MDFKHYNPEKPRKALTIDLPTWNKHKTLIVDMHERGYTRNRMMEHLRTHCDFDPTLGQLAARLKAWNLNVYQPRQKSEGSPSSESADSIDLNYAAQKAEAARFKQSLEEFQHDACDDFQPSVTTFDMLHGIESAGNSDLEVSCEEDITAAECVQRHLHEHNIDGMHKHSCPLGLQRSLSWRRARRRPRVFETPDTCMARQYLRTHLPSYLQTSIKLSRVTDVESLLSNLELFAMVQSAMGNWYEALRICDCLRKCQDLVPRTNLGSTLRDHTRWLRCLSSVPHSRTLLPDHEALHIEVSTFMFHNVEPLSMTVDLNTEGVNMDRRQVAKSFCHLEGWTAPSTIDAEGFVSHLSHCANFEQVAFCLRLWCFSRLAESPEMISACASTTWNASVYHLLLWLVPNWLSQTFTTLPYFDNICDSSCGFARSRTKQQVVSLLTITIYQICKQAFSADTRWMEGEADLHTLLLDACQVREAPQRSVRKLINSRFSVHTEITEHFKRYLVPSARQSATRPVHLNGDQQTALSTLLERLIESTAQALDFDDELTTCTSNVDSGLLSPRTPPMGIEPMVVDSLSEPQPLAINTSIPHRSKLTPDVSPRSPGFGKDCMSLSSSPSWSFEHVTGYGHAMRDAEDTLFTY